MTLPQPLRRSFNPMQQHVLDSLAKQPEWTPISREVVEGIRTQLHHGLADLAEKLDPQRALWVSKHKLTTVHGCEAHHIAGLTDFAWSVNNVKGTVLHKAVELGLNWQGAVIPADIVDIALNQLADDDMASAGPFIEQLSPSERAQLRSSAIDLYTKFDESFPPLKAAWRPVLESSARYEMFGQRINLSTRADLTLGAPGSKVIVDLKSGRIQANHREELRFYALVEAMRTGQAPRRLATYSLVTARAEVEDVTEGVLQAAVRKTIDGIHLLFELQRERREPTTRPGTSCLWCPLATSCATGIKYLAQRDDPDAALDY